MNLGQAVAVCLYELSRDLRPLPTKSSPQENIASAGDRERMTEVLLETLQKSDYFSAPDSPERRVEVRRLIYRLHLTSQDARIWMGMLRQTLWKVCQSDENPE